MATNSCEEEGRPLPEDMLVIARRDEKKAHEGQLTVYLGYAPGVGKTYAMLQDALQRLKEGKDVVIGYIETHDRPETNALVSNFEIIPTVSIQHQGLSLEEMDLDAIIRRHPQIVLVDELAHTNAPGSRHVKRYQDVEEILQAGISVYTTVNIQHIESQNDAVAQIIGIRVSEIVPDKFFSDADEIRLIDVTPEELEIRLKAGKVYVKDMADAAVLSFFRTGNLLALRQLALRFMAVYTDQQMIGYMRTRAIPGPWPAVERLLVCIRPGPTAESMVRAAYRLATRFDADWIVFSVDVSDDRALSSQERAWLNQALETGRRLDGRIVRYRGSDIADEITRYARRNNVSMIMLGKPHGIDVFFSPVYRVIRQSQGIDIHLYEPKGNNVHIPLKKQLPLFFTAEYAISLILIAAVVGVNFLLREHIGPSNLLFIQLIPVLVSAFFFRRRVALFTAGVSILVFDFLFVKPYYTFSVSDWEYFIAFIGYVTIALIISSLATRLRHLLPQIWQSEAEVGATSGLSRELVEAKTQQDVFRILANQMHNFGPGAFAVLISDHAGLQIVAGGPDYPLNDKERAIAHWAYENGQIAGHGTDNLPAGRGYYIPLKTHRKIFGLLAFAFEKPEVSLTPENKEIFETMAFLGALALERL
jgi:two-component system, OmpR family, sensor histidine kinase KdpD